MMTEEQIPPETSADPVAPRAQIAGLIEDVKALAQAEIDYARARLSYSGAIAKRAGLFALLAFMVFGSACIALVIGTMLIIDHYWGPWAATIITVLSFALIALLLGLRAQAIAKRLDFGGDDNG